MADGDLTIGNVPATELSDTEIIESTGELIDTLLHHFKQGENQLVALTGMILMGHTQELMRRLEVANARLDAFKPHFWPLS